MYEKFLDLITETHKDTEAEHKQFLREQAARIVDFKCDQRCVICGDGLFSEHPNTIRQPNPLTFRMAWMHLRCCMDAFEQIADVPAKNPEYQDRLEEYNMKFD
jgi:hypothetical protein